MHTHAHTQPATPAEITRLQDEARDVAVAEGPAAAVHLFEGRLPRSKSWIKRHIGLLLTDLDLLVRVVQYADPVGESAAREADKDAARKARRAEKEAA